MVPARTGEGVGEGDEVTLNRFLHLARHTYQGARGVGDLGKFLRSPLLHSRTSGLRVSNAKHPSSVRADRIEASAARRSRSSTRTWNAWPVITTKSNSRSKLTEARSPKIHSMSARLRACSSIPGAGSSPHNLPV